jgi:hypothetical protein
MTTLGIVVLVAVVLAAGVAIILIWRETSRNLDAADDQDIVRTWLIDTVYRVGVPLAGHWDEPFYTGAGIRPIFRVSVLAKADQKQMNALWDAVDSLREKMPTVRVIVDELEE